MEELFIKGTAIGFDYKNWREDREIFSSLLLSVMQTWMLQVFDSKDHFRGEFSDEQKREFGKIKSAILGFEGDLHNLIINYHLMLSLIDDGKLNNGLKPLYLSLLVENYLTNLRSIYDFCSLFPRLILPQKCIKQISGRKYSDSLNTLIKYCESDNSYDILETLTTLMVKTKNSFSILKTIRDLIIHKGKESIIEINKQEILFRIPTKAPYGKENALPDILELGEVDYPLIDYLRKMTLFLIEFMEELGLIIMDKLQKDDSFRLTLSALVGIGIKDFNDFLFPIEE